MSTNAFARSRPRVRQQRISRTHSCDHPRFLQLVNELARLNEVKKKKQLNEDTSDQAAIDNSTGSVSGDQHTCSSHLQQNNDLTNNTFDNQANTSSACSSSDTSQSAITPTTNSLTPNTAAINATTAGQSHNQLTTATGLVRAPPNNNDISAHRNSNNNNNTNSNNPTTSTIQSNCANPIISSGSSSCCGSLCTQAHITARSNRQNNHNNTNSGTSSAALSLCQCSSNYCCSATPTTAPVCYRSLDNSNQSTSNANSHDYYNRLQNAIGLSSNTNVCSNHSHHRQNHNQHQQPQQQHHHNHHHSLPQQQHNHYQPTRDQQNQLAHHLIQFGNIPMHHNHHHHHLQQQQQQQQTHPQQTSTVRCVDKSSSSSMSTNSPFGYSKQGLVEQNGPEFSSNYNNNSNSGCSSSNNINNNNSDLRQDENRSKRKRSSNDSPAHLKKCASGSSSTNSSTSSSNSASCCAANSKRHKSAVEAARPLSPSFTKCPICLLDCMDRDPSFTNTCFHLFCFVCIDNWTKNKATCPLCRTKFTKIIYNIRSATSFDEKNVSPVRRDDDDGYIADRLMIEHLSSLNSNSSASNRNNDEFQFVFEELNIPQYFSVNHIDPRQVGHPHPFTPVSTQSATDFPNVSHSTFNPASYPMASNYILFQPNRIHSPTINAAITSAYNPTTGLPNISDPSIRRTSRGGRYIYSRNHEPPSIDTSGPGTRMSSRLSAAPSSSNQPIVTLERHHHHQPHQHQRVDHSHHHQHSQHRANTLDMISSRNQRADQTHPHIQIPYAMQPRHNPTAYPRRPYSNSQVEHQHILDTLYRQMPDI